MTKLQLLSDMQDAPSEAVQSRANPLNTKRNPSKQTVQQYFARLHHSNCLDQDDFLSVLKQVKAILNSSILSSKYYVWYQSGDPNNPDPAEQPFMLVFGSIGCMSKALEFGQHVVGYDATHQVTSYGYPLWMLTGRDLQGHGFPLIYAISSNHTAVTQTKLLSQMQIGVTAVLYEAGLLPLDKLWTPSAFVIDKDPAALSVSVYICSSISIYHGRTS